jgi:hypothetical protein
MLPTSASPVAIPMRMSTEIGTLRNPSNAGNSARNGATRASMSSAAKPARRACSPSVVKGGPQ